MSKKICLLNEYAYSLLTGKGSRVGGAELQMTILAKELAKIYDEVSFITFEKTKESKKIVGGIRLFNPFYNMKSGYSYLLPYNIIKLFKTLNHIKADIYIQKGKSPLTSIILLFARLRGSGYIHILSSENNASSDLKISSFNETKNYFYRLGVKNCDQVVCQTNRQEKLLYKTIKKTGIVIKNFYDVVEIKDPIGSNNDLKILWVGRLLREKRPEIFLSLAQEISDKKFVMICTPSDEEPDYYFEIKKTAEKLKNVNFVGFVPHEEIFKYYKNSYFLINTSSKEGFPNTFLEAWGNGILVLSLEFDPDEIISTYQIGLYCNTYPDLLNGVRMLLKNDQLRKELGSKAKKYILKEHDKEKLTNKYKNLIQKLILEKRGRGRGE